MAVLHHWDQERQPGLPRSSPSRNAMLGSGPSGAHQGDTRHRHGELCVGGVVTAPKGELVGCPANDNRFVPTLDQTILGEDNVAWLDGVPPSAGEIGCDWLARVVTGFPVRIDGGDDLLVQVVPDWRDHRWAGRMDLASWEFSDKIGRPAVGDLDYVKVQLFRGGSSRVGLGMREPGCPGPPITVEAKHDDFG